MPLRMSLSFRTVSKLCSKIRIISNCMYKIMTNLHNNAADNILIITNSSYCNFDQSLVIPRLFLCVNTNHCHI